jgi:probable DNA metabolism protein
MTDFVYDGSFEGLLTAVFEIYEYKASAARIIPEGRYQPDVFAEKRPVISDATKANRVWKGLQRRLSSQGLLNVFSVYLSERTDTEALLLDFFRMVFANTETVEENYGSPVVLQIAQIGKQLHREKHRFEAFVRFVQLSDGLYFATIDPDFNVLPLITPHFTDRYADQRWLIYDTRRGYGMYYDLEKVEEVHPDFLNTGSFENPSGNILDASEELSQQLWQLYFQSVNISERRNLKLHRKNVPVRYWKYLTEKQQSTR